jgi:hypothetical protein
VSKITPLPYFCHYRSGTLLYSNNALSFRCILVKKRPLSFWYFLTLALLQRECCELKSEGLPVALFVARTGSPWQRQKLGRVSILKMFKHSTQVSFYISVRLAPNFLHVEMVGRLDEPMSGSASVSEFSLM